jgi:hypothetical protein
MCGVYPDADVKTAGDEISSTYEGRYLTLLESELVHPYHSDGFVDKGDPVCFCLTATPTDYGWGVGVAMNSASAVTDKITVDTEGIWALQVYAEDDSGNSAVNVGDALYMRVGNLPGAADADGTGDGEISKMQNLATQVFIGYALGTIASGGDGVIAVKVHFCPEEQQDEFAILTGATADNMKSFNLTDQQINASGYTRAVYINVTQTGDKTGSGELNCLGIDASVAGNMTYCYLSSLYLVTTGNPTISLASAFSVYIDDLGTACAQLHMLDLQYGSTNAPTTRNAYIRFRNHSDNTPTSVLFLQANNNAYVATNFIETGGNNEHGPVYPAQTTTGDEVYTYKVRCLYGADTFYLCGVASS